MTAIQPAPSIIQLSETPILKGRTLWQDALLHLLRDRLTMLTLLILVLLTIFCLAGPPLVENVLKVDVTRTNSSSPFFAARQEGHLLGTDHLGRDQLIRLMYGGRVSLAIAFSASLMIILIGVVTGLIAGFYGGRVDDFITWIINTLSSIPPLFILLIAAALWQPDAPALIIILALLGWVGTSRLVRAEVLSLKERDYVLAARALGATDWRLLASHIFPNLMSIVIVTGSIIAGNLILVESGFELSGGGCAAAGAVMGQYADRLCARISSPAYIWWCGRDLLIMITVMCFYLVGDGLRDALDPHRVKLSKPPK